MASEKGIFLDVLARLDMASVARVLSKTEEEFRRGGRAAGDAFAEGGVSGLRVMQDEFRELSKASDLAYADMQRGLADLQVAEARVNELRARNFQATADEMIAAQKRVDESILNTQRLIEDSRRSSAASAAYGAPVPYRGGEEEDRRGRPSRPAFLPAGLGRVGNALGIGAVAATAFGGIDVVRQSAQMQDALNRLVTVSGELPNNLRMIQDTILQIATKTGYNPQDLANVSLQAEKRGYQGADLGRILDVTAQLSRQEKIPLDEALQGIAITAQNYKIAPDQLANVASQLNVAVGRSGTSMQGFVGALPNVEQRAAAAGISQQQVWGVLAQLTRSGLSADRASENEDSLIRSLARPNGPAQDMINTLFTQAGAKNPNGSPMTAADIKNNLPQLQLTGAVNAIMNQGVLPNLTSGQRVLLPTVFKNMQAQENIDTMREGLTDPKAREFADSPLMAGGAMSPMQVTKAAEKAGVAADEISKLRDLAKAEQVQHGFSAQLKGRDSDVQSITGILSRVFGTVEASRAAMIIGAGDNPAQTQAQTADAVNAIGAAHADPQGNVEGFNRAMDTTLAQADRAKAAWHDVAITLGNQLSPAVKDVMSGLADFGNWLVQHQGALDAFAATLGGIATIWAGNKLAKGIKGFVQPTEDLLKFFGGKLGGVMPNTGVVTNPYQGGSSAAAGGELGAGVEAGAKKGAEILAAGVSTGAKEGATALAGGVSTGGKEAAVEIAGGMEGAGAGVGSKAGGGFMAAVNPAIIGAMIAQAFYANVDPSKGFGKDAHDWMKNNGLLPGERPGGKPGEGQPDQGHLVQPDAGAKTPTQRIKDFFSGWAHGGVVGYWGGGKVADPYSQPLLNQPDMKRDSLLGMLPSGMPVGLRGGEGILTPDAVARIGGKSAIDSLNSGLGKWANPVYTATTFYDSFATGFAKYSPYGKPLKASAEALKAMLKDQMDDPQGGRGRGGMPKEIEEMLAAGMSPEEILQSLGATQGKRGGFMLPNGSYLSREGRSLLGIPASTRGGGGGSAGGKAAWFGNEDTVHSVFSKYFPESEWGAYRNLEMHEAGFNPTAENPSGAYGIGQFMPYTWGKYGTGPKTSDLATQADYQMKYIQGRYGSPGSAWGQYFNHAGGEGSYSGGGIVGFDEGGVTPWTQAKSGGAGVLHPTDLGGLLGGAGGGYGKPGAPAKLGPQKPDIAPPDTGGLPPMHGGVSNLAAAQGDPNLRARADAIKGGIGGPPGVNSAPGSAPSPGPGVKPAPTAGDRTAKENPSRPEGMSNDSKGFGIGGGIIGAAESAASSMGGPIGGAAQPAMQLMNRAIGYGGQLAAIGLTGLMETFLPNNSELADPSNSLPGKIIFGLAGAHPSNPNIAGKSASQIKPEEAKSIDEGADKNKLTPTVNIQGDIHNYSGEGTAVQRAIEHGFTAATNGMNINN